MIDVIGGLNPQQPAVVARLYVEVLEKGLRPTGMAAGAAAVADAVGASSTSSSDVLISERAQGTAKSAAYEIPDTKAAGAAYAEGLDVNVNSGELMIRVPSPSGPLTLTLGSSYPWW